MIYSSQSPIVRLKDKTSCPCTQEADGMNRYPTLIYTRFMCEIYMDYMEHRKYVECLDLHEVFPGA